MTDASPESNASGGQGESVAGTGDANAALDREVGAES